MYVSYGAVAIKESLCANRFNCLLARAAHVCVIENVNRCESSQCTRHVYFSEMNRFSFIFKIGGIFLFFYYSIFSVPLSVDLKKTFSMPLIFLERSGALPSCRQSVWFSVLTSVYANVSCLIVVESLVRTDTYVFSN